MKQAYYPSHPSKFIICLDANNLYGCAMSLPLPTHGFKWMNDDEFEKWRNMPDSEGCILDLTI